MSYFGFLAGFVGIPIALLAALIWWGKRLGRERPAALRNHSFALVVALHALIALIYTTPWDNYLVATRVWWYDPALVTGFTIGWVPIEEYTFFVVQPILTGLWLHVLLLFGGRAPIRFRADSRLRRLVPTAGGLLWLGSLLLLASGWNPGTYLGLELAWALPPILVQLAFGADILWHYWRPVLLGVAIPTLYLSAADALAIGAGTWTINPTQSLDLHLFGVLPLEEFIFFLVTNTLVVFGVTLAIAQQSQERLASLRQWPLLARRAFNRAD